MEKIIVEVCLHKNDDEYSVYVNRVDSILLSKEGPIPEYIEKCKSILQKKAGVKIPVYVTYLNQYSKGYYPLVRYNCFVFKARNISEIAAFHAIFSNYYSNIQIFIPDKRDIVSILRQYDVTRFSRFEPNYMNDDIIIKNSTNEEFSFSIPADIENLKETISKNILRYEILYGNSYASVINVGCASYCAEFSKRVFEKSIEYMKLLGSM